MPVFVFFFIFLMCWLIKSTILLWINPAWTLKILCLVPSLFSVEIRVNLKARGRRWLSETANMWHQSKRLATWQASSSLVFGSGCSLGCGKKQEFQVNQRNSDKTLTLQRLKPHPVVLQPTWILTTFVDWSHILLRMRHTTWNKNYFTP